MSSTLMNLPPLIVVTSAARTTCIGTQNLTQLMKQDNDNHKSKAGHAHFQ